MRTDKYDRYIWVFLGLVVIGCVAFIAGGCKTQQEWQAAMLSTELGYALGDNDLDTRGGKSHNDGDFQAITLTIRPFQYWAWRAQAEATAFAITEQRYAERPPPPAPAKEEVKCPSAK